MPGRTSPAAVPDEDRSRPDTPPHRYAASLADAIERRWQDRWETERTFRAVDPGDEDFDPSKTKFYCLDMFPYPSGAGLHVGHPLGYIATDVICRYRRMQGCNVLHPMGWDAFGLPAEQYAIETGVHPEVTTRRSIDTFRTQLQRFGFSYDWSRELATIDPAYYRWTQWIWLRAFHAWYDPSEDRARPIEDLLAMLTSGAMRVAVDSVPCRVDEAPPGSRSWADLDPGSRRQVIDSQRLAYLAEQPVNWCPKLGTVLANEEVIDGRSERGGHPVHRRLMKQWVFRITAYAERLLEDLRLVDWPESTRLMQAAWIGRSEGAEIDFALDEAHALRIFTTRPDTIFGATFMVLAPEHPLVATVLEAPGDRTDVAAVREEIAVAARRSDRDRTAETGDITGVDLGIDVINPATGKRIPVWVADYVLMGYGHGAIMSVPAHDERDHAFARRHGLPIVEVVRDPDGPAAEGCHTGDGTCINSSGPSVSLDGLDTPEAKARITAWLAEWGLGLATINYRLRDWLFSRQRYWGEPFPVVHDEAGRPHAVSSDHLPVRLPPLEDYRPVESDDPEPMLARADEWVRTTAGEAGVPANVLPPDEVVTREANTMPGWAGSCWYHLRFCDPGCTDRFASREAERYWMGGGGVDLYVGGAEHAVLHLLYARFWHKLLFDLGEVSTPEPFGRLFHQGMLTAFAYQRPDGSLVPADAVHEGSDEGTIEIDTGERVERVVAKMSKSLRNVVNPDDVIREYGADTLRLYEMAMGPLEASKPWNPRDIIGLHRFLQRAWRLAIDEDTGEPVTTPQANPDLERRLHGTIDRVGRDIDRLALNTAIAALIEFVNDATAAGGLTREQCGRFVLLLAPFAPHIAEEIWARIGHARSLAHESWPTCDEAMLRQDTIELAVQVMGRVRGHVTVPADASDETIERAAMADERIATLLKGRTVRRIVVVPGRLVNIVTGD